MNVHIYLNRTYG